MPSSPAAATSSCRNIFTILRMECAVHRGAGTHHRPHQAVRHRIGRFRQANLSAQRAHDDRRGRERDQDPARQHALRPARAGEFGTYFIGYSRSPSHDRADAREHVHWPPARQLRPAARLQPRRHRKPVLRAVRDISGNVAEDQPAVAVAASAEPAVEASPPGPSVNDGSLGIGSLKGDIPHE
jgi:hypothetical protein